MVKSRMRRKYDQVSCLALEPSEISHVLILNASLASREYSLRCTSL